MHMPKMKQASDFAGRTAAAAVRRNALASSKALVFFMVFTSARGQNATGRALAAADHRHDDAIADGFFAEALLGNGGGGAVLAEVAGDAISGLCRARRGKGEETCTGEQQNPGLLHGCS